MFSSEPKKKRSPKAARKDRAAEIANTFEWLITAFILALIVRAFLMEAFRIPTGSMAHTLMGDHYRLRCSQCGYNYEFGFSQNSIRHRNIASDYSRCPSCGHYQPPGGRMGISNGDRILVLKCIYQFFEPKRWDVVVFKNPPDPTINYIKRLVGLPGETVEIIDGDIYINGQISRKPAKVQNELWMPVYDNDYQPARPLEGSFNGHAWRQPFDIANSKWKLDEVNPTKFRLECPAEQTAYLLYDSSAGNDFRTTYAYNDVEDYRYRPYCSDIMVRFYVSSNNQSGRAGIALSKYETVYSAWVDLAGEMVIAKTTSGEETVELARKSIEIKAYSKPTQVKLANVDHQLTFEFGSEKLTYDLGRGSEDAGERKPDSQPQVKLFGSGKLTLRHVSIFRDIHYTSDKFVNGPKTGRAIEGQPFSLGKDQFFMLGDNSPNSADGRWWDEAGKGNNGRLYRQGIVPREYLVGKAMFVYWPGGFKPFERFRFAVIPNIGRMRFIYGGSDKGL